MRFLTERLGIKPEKTLSQPFLLGRDPESLQRNFDFFCHTLGFKPEYLSCNAQVLAMNPVTVKRKWDALRQIFPADSIRLYPILLGLSTENVMSTSVMLSACGIPVDKPLLYAASAMAKRRKMLWVADNVFGASTVDGERRREAIEKMRILVSKHPMQTLYPSVSRLERNVDKLKALARKV